MRFNKVLNRLKELDNSTKKDFHKYLLSPYFDEPYQARELYEYLLSIHGSYPAKSLTKEAIAKGTKRLKSVFQQDKGGTYLLRALENFLATRHLLADSYNFSLAKMQALKERHWFDLFNDLYAGTVAAHKAENMPSLKHFEVAHKLTEAEYNGFDAKSNHSLKNNIEPVIKSLDVFYAIKKIRYMCEMANRQRVLGITYQPNEAAPLLKLLETCSENKNGYIVLFTNAFGMLNAPSYNASITYSNTIRQYINKHGKQQPDQSIKEVVKYARIHCVYWSNRGVKEAAQEYLWWADYEWKNNLLTDKGIILPVTFVNIISTAAQTTQPEQEVRAWIQRLAPLLPVAKKKARLNFAEGIYAFVSGNCKEALNLFDLAATDKSDVAFNCIVRRWQIMSSFENAPYNPGLQALLNAFNQYVKRSDQLPADFKRMLRLFIHYALKMLYNTLKADQLSLYKKLQAEDFFAGKYWILEKIEVNKKRKRGT